LKENIKINSFTVNVDGKSQQVFIPSSGDKSHDEYLEVAEREKTLDQLKRKPAREKSKVSAEDKAGAIKEMRDYKKQRGMNPRYISGDYTS